MPIVISIEVSSDVIQHIASESNNWDVGWKEDAVADVMTDVVTVRTTEHAQENFGAAPVVTLTPYQVKRAIEKIVVGDTEWMSPNVAAEIRIAARSGRKQDLNRRACDQILQVAVLGDVRY